MNDQKSVLRSATVMLLFVGLVGIWMGGCENQEQRVEKLIKQLRDQNEEVRWDAGYALGQIGKDAVPALVQALQDQNSQVRGSAAVALGEIGEGAVDAVPALIQALQDQDAKVRANAAMALGEIGTPEAIKAVEGEVSALIQPLHPDPVMLGSEQILHLLLP